MRSKLAWPDDGVRDAALRLVGRRLVREHQIGHFDGSLQILRGENVFCGARQHTGAVGMLGEARAELHAGVDRELVSLDFLCRRQLLFVLGERTERGVSAAGRARVARDIRRPSS
jgi:hypothetical protein